VAVTLAYLVASISTLADHMAVSSYFPLARAVHVAAPLIIPVAVATCCSVAWAVHVASKLADPMATSNCCSNAWAVHVASTLAAHMAPSSGVSVARAVHVAFTPIFELAWLLMLLCFPWPSCLVARAGSHGAATSSLVTLLLFSAWPTIDMLAHHA